MRSNTGILAYACFKAGFKICVRCFLLALSLPAVESVTSLSEEAAGSAIVNREEMPRFERGTRRNQLLEQSEGQPEPSVNSGPTIDDNDSIVGTIK